MFQELGLDGWTPQSASVVLGLLLGAAFGALAESSRFCLRRAVAGDATERGPALGVWLIALAVAIAGTAALLATGLVDVSQNRFLASRLPVAAIVTGGLMFGAGMILTRGCVSRLTVLAATGNLRAVAAFLVFAIFAHATLKGALAPVRTWFASFGIDAGQAVSLAALPGGIAVWATIIAGGLGLFAIGLRARWSDLVMGAGIGALVPLGWLGTGFLLHDEFAPISVETLAFTSAGSESLFWWIAGTAVAPAFGVGLLGGTLAGSALSSVISGRFGVVGFSERTPTARYLAGGALMGVGGVLAGGCTVGAGLGGVSLLSTAAILALASIVAGGLAARAILAREPSMLASIVTA